MRERHKVAMGFWYGVVLGIFLYAGVAWFVFEWRNPLCNEAAFYRHFVSVITFDRLPQYQYQEQAQQEPL